MEPEQRAQEGASDLAPKPGAGCGGIVPPPEHRWKPGKSGNPGGRPAYRGVSKSIRRLLAGGPAALQRAFKEPRNNAEALAAAVIMNAQEVSSGAGHLKILLDRVEGPVEQRVHNTGDMGPAVVIEVVEAKRPEPEAL